MAPIGMTRRQAVGALAAGALLTPPLVGGGGACADEGSGPADVEILALGREIEELARQHEARYDALERRHDPAFSGDAVLDRLQSEIADRQWRIAETVSQTLRGVAVLLTVVADWQPGGDSLSNPSDTALANARTALEQIGASL